MAVAPYLPVLLALLLMLPRLQSAQFGLFDDPTTLAVSRRIMSGAWTIGDEAGNGRFRPVYWLYYGLVYWLAGKDPFCFYIGNTLVLATTVAALVRFTMWLTKSRLQAFVAGMLFVLAGPTVETVYTLSKPELVQGIWLVLSVLSLHALGRSPKPWRFIAVCGLVSVTVLLASLSKETGLVLPFIAAAWCVLAKIRHLFRPGTEAKALQASGCYLAGAAVGDALYLVIRHQYLPFGLTERGYADQFLPTVERMLASARVWFDWLNRDYLFLLPVGLAVLALCALRPHGTDPLPGIVSGIWAAAWVILYLPWLFRVEYYLYPLSLGASILGAWLVGTVLQAARAGSRWVRLGMQMALLATAFLFCLTIPNNITNSRVQLAVDAANADMVSYIVRHVPSGSHIVVNIQEPNEYVAQLDLLLRDIEGRSDLSFDHFHFQDLNSTADGRDVYIVLPSIEGQFYQSVRLGVQEHTSRGWNESLLEVLESRLSLVFETRHTFRMLMVDAARLFCPLTPRVPYCDVPNTPLDTRPFAASWRVYRLNPPR